MPNNTGLRMNYFQNHQRFMYFPKGNCNYYLKSSIPNCVFYFNCVDLKNLIRFIQRYFFFRNTVFREVNFSDCFPKKFVKESFYLWYEKLAKKWTCFWKKLHVRKNCKEYIVKNKLYPFWEIQNKRLLFLWVTFEDLRYLIWNPSWSFQNRCYNFPRALPCFENLAFFYLFCSLSEEGITKVMTNKDILFLYTYLYSILIKKF